MTRRTIVLAWLLAILSPPARASVQGYYRPSLQRQLLKYVRSAPLLHMDQVALRKGRVSDVARRSWGRSSPELTRAILEQTAAIRQAFAHSRSGPYAKLQDLQELVIYATERDLLLPRQDREQLHKDVVSVAYSVREQVGRMREQTHQDLHFASITFTDTVRAISLTRARQTINFLRDRLNDFEWLQRTTRIKIFDYKQLQSLGESLVKVLKRDR